MTVRHWGLIQDTEHWRIACLAEPLAIEEFAVAPDALPEAIGEAVAGVLATLGYAGEPAILAIPSQQCLVAGVPIESPSQIRQRQTLLYQLEQCLPLAAEDTVADFVVRNQDVLGVAIEAAPERAVVEALESHGVQIQSITPLALLALQQNNRIHPRTDAHFVLWQNGQHVELLRLADGKLTAWQSLPADPQLLAQWLAVETLIAAGCVLVVPCHLSTDLLAMVRAQADVQVEEPHEETLTDAALAIAQDVLLGKEAAWIELRRDALGTRDAYRPIRGTLRFVLAAAAVFLMAVSAGLLIRAHTYRMVARDNQAEQASVFGEVFPGQATPAGIRSRLESERSKMAGVKGESAELPQQRPALAVLYDLLNSVPETLRCRLLEIRLDRARVQFQGELRSHGDADAIASGLQKRGYRVQPPRTQQLPGQGVTVRMAADSDDKDKKSPRPGGSS